MRFAKRTDGVNGKAETHMSTVRLSGTLREQIAIGGEGTGYQLGGLAFEVDVSRVNGADAHRDAIVTLPGVLRKRSWPTRGEVVTFDALPTEVAEGEVLLRVSGLLRGGVVAVGGETTGYLLEGVSFEVAPPTSLDVSVWVGERVTAEGTFEVRRGVERWEYAVLVAAAMAPANEDPEIYTGSIALGVSGGFIPTTTQTIVTRRGRVYVKRTSFFAEGDNGLRRLPDVPKAVADSLFALVEACGFREIPSGEPSSFSTFVHVAMPTWQHTVYLRHGAGRAGAFDKLVAALQRVVGGGEADEPAPTKPPKPGRFIVTELIAGGACQIIPEGSYYVMIRRQAYGPDSREACVRWVAENCQ